MDSYSSIEDEEPIGDIAEVNEKIRNLKRTQENMWSNFMAKYSVIDETLPDLGIDEIESYVFDNLSEEGDEKCSAQNSGQVEINFDLKNDFDGMKDIFEENIDKQITQTCHSPKGKMSHSKKEECCHEISTNKNDNLQNGDRLKLSNDMTKTQQLKALQKFVEEELNSPLEYYYIKLLSSCIRRDKKQSYWRNLLVEEVTKVRKRVNDDDILIYLRGVLYPINQQALFSLIEDDCKSNLKFYFDKAYENISSDEEYWIQIEKEWQSLNETIPEKYLCVYHTILYGVTPIFPELYCGTITDQKV